MTATAKRPSRHGFVTGAEFVLDQPADPPALWGDGKRVAWARGEGLMIYAPQGVGKTTLAQCLVNARVGIGRPEFLGLPVRPANKVLYLALDRPPQIARSWRRMITDEQRKILTEHVEVWQGPLPFRLSEDAPEKLTDWALERGATCVVVDSLTNLASKLSTEETGQLVNQVMQKALVNGIDWLALHHNRKATGDNKTPNALDDVYGSTWLTTGMGSVFCIWGKAGDSQVSLTHLKQPAEIVGPLTLMHDHAAGAVTAVADIYPGDSAQEKREKLIRGFFLQQGGVTADPMTVEDLATFGGDRSVKEALKALVERGVLDHHEGGGAGNRSTWTMRPLQSS